MPYNKKKQSITRLTVAAMLTTLSVVIGIFCKSYLNFAFGLFRITFENMPNILAGLVAGPVYGGAVGLFSDLISYLLSAQAYPLNLLVTLGATLVGVLSGIVSRFIIKKKGSPQIILAGALSHVICSMIIKPIGLYQFYGSLVLWRIPLYLLIAPLEIAVLCLLLKRKNFARTIGYLGGEENELR